MCRSAAPRKSPCDSSPNRHASRHARDDGHPIARSAEQGEEWSWCFVDEVAFVVEPGSAAAEAFAGDAAP
jgi:hypothetical protein